MILKTLRQSILTYVRRGIQYTSGLFPKLNIPLKTSLVPSIGSTTSTFSRTTAGTVQDFEGSLLTALINELRFPGARRVRNLLSNTEILSTQTVTVSSGTSYILSFSGTGSVTLSGAATGTLSGSTGRVQVTKSATTSSLTLTVTGSVLQAQLERVTGTQTIASEYVSVGELSWPYHGAGVDGVKYFTTDREGASISGLSGYLVEPESTNLIPYSADFTYGWSVLGANRYAGSIDSPLGTLHGTLVTCTTDGTSILYLSTSSCVAVVAGTSYTISILSKAGTTDFISLTFSSTAFTNGGYAIFDLVNGIVDTEYNSTAEIEEVDDGWFRCCITNTASLSSTQSYCIITPSRSSASRAIGVSGDTVYIDASQTEVGSAATSYIPTYGATVTRTADVLTYDVEDVITQGQGSLYCEFTWNGSDDSFSFLFDMTNGSSSDRILVNINQSTLELRANIISSSVSQALVSTTILKDTEYKVMITYQDNDFKFYLNGSLIGSDTACTIPTNLDVLSVGISYINSNQLNGTVKNMKYWNEVFNQAKGEAMTA